ncbi:LacI family DNA-binding transcriptional regulator, partial [Enterococcus faecium]|nr:LacI family DNA-binding transcriptional regulator [Enterococcus faecium]
MVKKKITIKEVAKLSGVSITTVSLILNGNTEK